MTSVVACRICAVSNKHGTSNTRVISCRSKFSVLLAYFTCSCRNSGNAENYRNRVAWLSVVYTQPPRHGGRLARMRHNCSTTRRIPADAAAGKASISADMNSADARWPARASDSLRPLYVSHFLVVVDFRPLGACAPPGTNFAVVGGQWPEIRAHVPTHC